MAPQSLIDWREYLKSKILHHKHDPKFQVQCDECGVTFKKWPSFRQHVYRNHAQNGTFLINGQEVIHENDENIYDPNENQNENENVNENENQNMNEGK